MKINRYSEIILDEDDIIRALYSGKIKSPKEVNIDDESLVNQYNASIEENADHLDYIAIHEEDPNGSIELFDESNQLDWFIPDEYKNFDIATWLFNQCQTEEQKSRVEAEIELFIQHNMYDVLICLKYLVDTMRQNKIVWGVGRGSSVASYCLYLIGVHKVDSIKYQLDITEFLKGE